MSDTQAKRKKGRSPSYPAINLREAIDKAQAIYSAEGRHAAPIPTIAQHLGYSASSGTAAVVVSALRKFGLLEYEGTGKERSGRLTDLAFRIVLDERRESPERQSAIREAALRPSIHEVLLDEYGAHLPSDATLRFKLLRELGFTESAVDDFIEEFRQTLAFAGLDAESSDSAQAPAEDAELVPDDSRRLAGPETEPPAVASTPGPSGPRDATDSVVQLPLPSGGWIRLEGPFPLRPASWEYMMEVLTAMKAGLVANDDRVG